MSSKNRYFDESSSGKKKHQQKHGNIYKGETATDEMKGVPAGQAGNSTKARFKDSWKSKHKFRGTHKSTDDETIAEFAKELRNVDPFPGDAPVSEKSKKKYVRGSTTHTKGIRTVDHAKRIKQKEKKFYKATELAARSELLLTEQAGYIEADEGERTSDYSQHTIADCVDIASAEKFFELKLDKFGPYKVNYTRNGRFLLLCGGRGHVAAIDWQTKKLMCEMNVMETCNDAKWLHIETMYAVAQRKWTYIYDNQGIELHCMKNYDAVLRMEFLPYHFLLAAANAKGYIQWLDVSIGQQVAGHTTGLGRLDVMCQNPQNAIVHLGHSGGTVTLWSPNVREPLVKMLCHRGGTRSVAVTKDGNYMATSGVDRTLKIWDLRTYKALHSYRISAGAGHMSFSQRDVLATSMNHIVQVYKDPCRQAQIDPYLIHRAPAAINGLQFCPHEDVLGVGHSQGFASLLVPGAGEPNFDALETNPYRTKKQRQEYEVKMLLEKIQPELINIDNAAIGKVDMKTLQDTMDEKAKQLVAKPTAIEFEPKYKMKGRNKAGRVERRKKGVKEDHKRQQIRTLIKDRQVKSRQKKHGQDRSSKFNVFDRFAAKRS